MGDITIWSNVAAQFKASQNAQTDHRGVHVVRPREEKEADAVTIDISDEGLTLQNEKINEDEKENIGISDAELESYAEQAQAAKDAGEGFKDMAKVMEIARRIANGDHVPATDEKKLMEFNKDLYQAAKAAAAMNANKKHKSYKSMYEDEGDEDMESKIRALDTEVDKANAASDTAESIDVTSSGMGETTDSEA